MTTTAEEDLVQLEKDIRALKIEYEQFFGGGRKRPPADTQWRVESLIKRYSDRGAAAKAIEAQRATSTGLAAPKHAAKGERPSPFAMSFSDPEHETKKVEQLYQKLVEVRTAAGEKGGTPSFEDFGKFVRQKTRELRGKKRNTEVEYTVSVEDG